jgi:Na+-transporting NADH:ubiquinone oxidoreductase subunit NqrF
MRMVRDDDASEEGEPVAMQPIIGIDALPPMDAALSVDPNEVTYPELATERQTQDDWDLQHNLTNLAILARDRNPDLDDDGARAFVMANREANAAMSAAPRPAAPPAIPGKVPLAQRVAQMRAGNKPPPPQEPGA